MAHRRLGRVRNGPRPPWEHQKRPWGALGASETAVGYLRSIRNGPQASRGELKRPKAALGASETALGCLGSI